MHALFVVQQQILEVTDKLNSMRKELDIIDSYSVPERSYLLDQIKINQSKLDTLEAVKNRLYPENQVLQRA